MEITKATTMGEMLQYDMGIAYVLMEAGHALCWLSVFDR